MRQAATQKIKGLVGCEKLFLLQGDQGLEDAKHVRKSMSRRQEEKLTKMG